jgi:crotonobetainyl-CoA:carnitine CoA-transferase CaiB-like acyl-CoA transferase
MAEETVLDLSDSIPGQFCGRLLSEASHEVVLVESPVGTWTRRRGPYMPGAQRPNDSYLFFHLNQGKHSLTLDCSSPSGEELLTDLIREAGVILLPADKAVRELVLECASADPRKITCVVDDFDQFTDYRDWAGSELAFQAMSGVMFENGLAAREPLYGCGYRSLYAAGVAAYIAVQAAVIERSGSGLGQQVGTVAAEVAASMNYCRGTQYWYNGSLDYREDPVTPRMTLRCADGWIVAFPGHSRWRDTCEAVGLPELGVDPAFEAEKDRSLRWPEIRALFQEAVGHRQVNEVMAAASERHAVLAPVIAPADLATDEHLIARDFWTTVEYEDDTRRALGPWSRFGEIPAAPSRPPYLGEHNDEVYAALGLSAAEVAALRDAEVI